MDLVELKAVYTIPEAWRDLGLPGEPGKCVSSPFRKDVSPSFSVFDGGMRFRDHATAEGGDVIDFIKKARGCETFDAIQFIEGRLGVVRPKRKSDNGIKIKPNIPPLRLGNAKELRELSERRGFMLEGLDLAQSRGFLRFTTLWGEPAWCIGDLRGQLHEFRRLDGEMWPAFGQLPARKSHCMGVGKAFPIGTFESEPFGKIAVVEGAPDFLGLFHFLVIEGKEHSVAPVAVLGADKHRLAPEALAKFNGKSICIYPHVDGAGWKAALAWATAFREAGSARVTAFDLSGLILSDGGPGKDVCDICRIHPDCFDGLRKFWEVLP